MKKHLHLKILSLAALKHTVEEELWLFLSSLFALYYTETKPNILSQADRRYEFIYHFYYIFYNHT